MDATRLRDLVREKLMSSKLKPDIEIRVCSVEVDGDEVLVKTRTSMFGDGFDDPEPGEERMHVSCDVRLNASVFEPDAVDGIMELIVDAASHDLMFLALDGAKLSGNEGPEAVAAHPEP